VERVRCGKVLLRCVCSAARRRLGAHGGGEGRGIMCRHAHSLLLLLNILTRVTVSQKTVAGALYKCQWSSVDRNVLDDGMPVIQRRLRQFFFQCPAECGYRDCVAELVGRSMLVQQLQGTRGRRARSPCVDMTRH